MKKVFYFLLLCVAGVLSSCSEDEGISKHEDVHEKSYGIDFTYNNYKSYTIRINKITGLLL